MSYLGLFLFFLMFKTIEIPNHMYQLLKIRTDIKFSF